MRRRNLWIRAAIVQLPVLLVLLGVPNSVSAEGDSPRVDAFGDPLPPGTVARLGTLRFVPPGGIGALAISPDGKTIVTGSFSGNPLAKNEKEEKQGLLCFWEVKTGTLRQRIVTPSYHVSALCVSHKGELIAAAIDEIGKPAEICVWRVSDGKLQWRQKRPFKSKKVTSLRFSADDDRLISTLAHAQERRVNDRVETTRFIETSEELQSNNGQLLRRHKIPFSKYAPPKGYSCQRRSLVAVSTDSRRIVSATSTTIHSKTAPANPNAPANLVRSDIKIFNRQLERLWTFNGLSSPISRLAISPDNRLAAIGCEREIWIVDLINGKKQLLAKNLKSRLDELTFATPTSLVAWMYASRFALWDVGKWKKSHEWRGIDCSIFAVSKDGKLFVESNLCCIRVRDLRSGRDIHNFPGHRNAYTQIAFRGPHELASASYHLLAPNKSSWILWDVGSKKEKEKFFSKLTPGSTDQCIRYSVRAGKYLRIDRKKRLQLCDVKTHKVLRSITATEYVTDKTIGRLSSCGRFGLLWTSDGNRASVQLYDFAKRKIVAKWHRKGEFALVPDFQFSENGLLSFEEADGRLAVMNLLTGEKQSDFGPQRNQENSDAIHLMRFTADNRYVIRTRVDVFDPTFSAPALVWDVTTANTVHRFNFRNGGKKFQPVTTTIEISPDNRLIAIGEFFPKPDKILIVELATGTIRGFLTGHADGVTDVKFSPDGKHLATASKDTTILIWDMMRPLQSGKYKKRLNTKELGRHWQTLVEPDGIKADVAIWSMIYAPQDSIPFLKSKLSPASPPNPKHLRQWLIDLDAENFKVRAAATKKIEDIGELGLPALRAALKEKSTLEKHLRLQALLKMAIDADALFTTAERVRQWRALEVLEKIGSAEALALVRRLSNGSPAARLTREAWVVLARLEERK